MKFRGDVKVPVINRTMWIVLLVLMVIQNIYLVIELPPAPPEKPSTRVQKLFYSLPGKVTLSSQEGDLAIRFETKEVGTFYWNTHENWKYILGKVRDRTASFTVWLDYDKETGKVYERKMTFIDNFEVQK